MNFNFLSLSAISIILLLVIPTTVVFGQTNPWGLFQQLCPTGRLSTGPQCQGLLQGQQPSSTTGTTTAAGTCPTGFVIQNNFCVPASTSTTTGTTAQPIANAGPSQTVSQGSLVTLVGTGSFATNAGATIVSYSWVQTSGSPTVSLTGANTATPSFTAPTVTTSLVFSLTVTDSTGAVSSPSTVTITVS
ncbi:MAG: hypothetical protein WCF23_18860 [Candidatus Nitrosopolaris sp.]